MSQLTDMTLAELQDALHSQSISSVEITEAFLDRIDALNPDLNAFITVTAEQAIKQAKAADQRAPKGTRPLSLGFPLLHQGILSESCGSKILANFVSPYDAHVVDQCLTAGMVTLGKLNMDEFAIYDLKVKNFLYDHTKLLSCLTQSCLAHEKPQVFCQSAVLPELSVLKMSTTADTGGSISLAGLPSLHRHLGHQTPPMDASVVSAWSPMPRAWIRVV